MSLSVGVDVGGTKVLGALVDDGPDGQPVVLARVRLDSLPGASGVTDQVVAAVREVCAAGGVTPAALAGVGVGVPGVVDAEAGTVTHAVNLGVIEPADLAGAIGERIGLPVRLENDLNAAALGAAAVLRLPRRDLAFLALGTGLAAGLLLDGRLRRGATGAAGEVGHVPYRPDGPVCACGQRGCLELYASGRALEAGWARRPAGAPEAGEDQLTPAPARLVAAARSGQAWAAEEVAVFVDAVAAAVRVLVLTCDVEHVVLGGGVAGLGGALLEPVRAALVAQSQGSPFLASLRIADRVQIVPPGADPAPVGAALAALSAAARPVSQEVPWRS